MFENKTFKGATIFSVSALALAISGAANAYSFNVNETEVTIGGYTKLDVIYDVDANMGKSVDFGAIRLDSQADGADGHFGMQAIQSRFGFQTATPLEGSVLKTNVEGDFWDGGGFRLRHAYGEWNGFLAGQTWVNFGDGLGTTPTIDFTGPGGQGNTGRSAQLRYTTGGLSLALEDNVKGNLDKTLVTGAVDKTSLPSLTARYTGGINGFDYSASALVQQVEHDNGTIDGSAMGWGVVAEASIAVTPSFTLRGSVTHGDGIGGYLNGSTAGTGYAAANGDVETITQSGANLGFSIAAGPGAINVSYSMVTADLDDAVADGAFGAAADVPDETRTSIYANYIWSPVKGITYGVEVGQHSRETVGGDEGDAMRVQGMVMYSF